MRFAVFVLALPVLLLAMATVNTNAVPMQVEIMSQQQDDLLKSDEVHFLISGILDTLLRPLKALIKAQIQSIINTIIDQGGQISGDIKAMIDRLIEVIRPFIISILNKLNDIIGAGVELKERIKMAIEYFFEYLGLLAGENLQIIKLLINYITEKLLGSGIQAELLASAAAKATITAMAVQPRASPLFISSIIDWIIKPIIESAQRQLKSVLVMLLDQVGHSTHRLLEHSATIAKAMMPSVVRILEITGNLHGEISDLKNSVTEAVTKILGNIISIGEESAHIMQQLIEEVSNIIVEQLQGGRALTSAGNDVTFLIIGRIINWIVQPIVGKVNDILDNIRQLINDQTEAAKQKLLQLYNELTLLLKGPVVRIIGILHDLGVDIADTAGAIKRTLELIIDSVSGIAELNKQLLKSILDTIIESLMNMIKPSLAVQFEYSILIDIINRILRGVVDQLNSLLDALRREIAEAIESITDVINRYTEKLAVILSPFINQILKIIEQLGLGGRDLVENVRNLLDILVDNLIGLTDANRRLLKELLNDLISKIVDHVRD